jgi:hypothetical protein
MRVLVTLEGSEPYTIYDFGDDISLTGEFEDRRNRCLLPASLAASAMEIFSRASHKPSRLLKTYSSSTR